MLGSSKDQNQLKSLKVVKSIGKDDGGYDRSPIFHSIINWAFGLVSLILNY